MDDSDNKFPMTFLNSNSPISAIFVLFYSFDIKHRLLFILKSFGNNVFLLQTVIFMIVTKVLILTSLDYIIELFMVTT
jgi:hypothetical protein